MATNLQKQRVAIGSDAHLAVEVEGSGEPVLLIAGLGGRLAFWHQQRPALTKHFQLVLHDHRGTGGSTRSDMDYSVGQMTSDVLALMDALAIERAHIVGHSTGGAIAQTLALNHAERVGRIVLSATWAGYDPFFEQLFKLRRQMLETCGPAAYMLDGTLRALPAAFLQERGATLEALVAERVEQFAGMAIELSRIDAVMAHDLRARLGDIVHPVLVICAADDQITPLPFSKELAAAIPGAQLAVLPFGGHFFPQVDPEGFNQRVLEFLRAA